jgi:N-acyl-D-amino-acid deacylase
MYDLLIRNVKIYDGSEGNPYIADIGIKGDKIEAIGDLKDAAAVEEIEAGGLSAMPGFIDTHCHSDMSLLYDRQHANGLMQGITTELLGQDGLSYVPLSPDNLKMYTKYLAGLNGYYPDVPLDFNTVEQYLERFHKKVAPNVAYQVPHGAIRLEAMGFLDRPLTGYALDKAKALMRQAFEEGAVAFSTGLSYYPCSYADTEELIELCKVCAEYDVPFVIHTRSVFRGEPFDPTLEAIQIARKAGCRLHFSHFRTSPANYGRTAELLEPIEKAIDEGMKITCETYCYYSGAGYAVVFLPPWAVEGGYEATLERLADKSLRERIYEGMRANTIPPVDGTFTQLDKNVQYLGMSFEEVARLRGQTNEEMMCDILLEEGLNVGYYANPTGDEAIRRQLDDDFTELLKKPYYMVCTDSIPHGLKPHPRAFGTFPRFLRLAREKGVPFETVANRMAKNPARTFRLNGRGSIETGNYADIVIFNEQTVTDTATYRDARRSPKGIPYVIVNGKTAVYDEKVTGVLNGHAICRGN